MFHKCDLECREYRDRDHPIPGRWQLGEWEFDKCPRTYVTENVEFWLKAYQMYKKGFLPSDPRWIKNTNKLIEILGFIDIEIANHQQEVEAKNGRSGSNSNSDA